MPFSTNASPRESLVRRIVWLGLFVISVAGLAIMTVSGIRQRNYVQCNAEQVSILIQYQREASIAAREERDAHDVVRRAQRDGNKAAQDAAIEKYFEVRKEADERRSRNPLPELPESVCGRDPKP
jgi:hypothetical protein